MHSVGILLWCSGKHSLLASWEKQVRILSGVMFNNRYLYLAHFYHMKSSALQLKTLAIGNAEGKDGISNETIINLPECGISKILEVINCSWTKVQLPIDQKMQSLYPF